MNKKQIRKSRKTDMRHFLRNYYGIDNEKLILKLCNLSHKDLKIIASLYGINLVRTKFELVTVEEVLMGNIVLVDDAFGNPAPYVNPNRILSCNCDYEDEFDLSCVGENVQDVELDKKGRQKSLKRTIKLKKGEEK